MGIVIIMSLFGSFGILLKKPSDARGFNRSARSKAKPEMRPAQPQVRLVFRQSRTNEP